MAFKSIVQTKIYSVILNVISVGYAFLSSAGKNVLFFLDEIIMQHQVSKCVKKIFHSANYLFKRNNNFH